MSVRELGGHVQDERRRHGHRERQRARAHLRPHLRASRPSGTVDLDAAPVTAGRARQQRAVRERARPCAAGGRRGRRSRMLHLAPARTPRARSSRSTSRSASSSDRSAKRLGTGCPSIPRCVGAKLVANPAAPASHRLAQDAPASLPSPPRSRRARTRRRPSRRAATRCDRCTRRSSSRCRARSIGPRYSGKVAKSHGMPAPSVSTSMSSTFSSVRAITSWCSGRVGAIEKPQLPATTVVTPWKHDGVSAGVPEHLRVVVGVDVDEPGRDHVVRPRRARAHRRGRRRSRLIATVGDRDVGTHAGRTGAVDDRAVLDDEIRGHALPQSPAGVSRGSPATVADAGCSRSVWPASRQQVERVGRRRQDHLEALERAVARARQVADERLAGAAAHAHG